MGSNGLEASCDVVFATIDDPSHDDEVVYFDDLYTPGTFWLNPPQPRDIAGNRCDPDTGELLVDDKFLGTRTCNAADERADNSSSTSQAYSKLSDQRGAPGGSDNDIQRILGDLAPNRRPK